MLKYIINRFLIHEQKMKHLLKQYSYLHTLSHNLKIDWNSTHYDALAEYIYVCRVNITLFQLNCCTLIHFTERLSNVFSLIPPQSKPLISFHPNIISLQATHNSISNHFLLLPTIIVQLDDTCFGCYIIFKPPLNWL